MSFPSPYEPSRPVSAELLCGSERQSLRDFAYFYEPFWRSGAASHIKTLLLFFDGIALTVPDYLCGAPFAADRAFADRLDDLGLLFRLGPESLVDRQVAESLGQLLGELFAAHAFDMIDRALPYRAPPRPRSGSSTDPLFTDAVLDVLVQSELARPTCDGAAISLHPTVRECVLIALPHILRASAEGAGYALQPMTTQPPQAHALLGLLSLEPLPTAGHLVAIDMEQVTCDLERIPLDDVLAFRSEYGATHRAYARRLREYVRDAALVPTEDRNSVLRDRRHELTDLADAARKIVRAAWHLPLVPCALGIVGSAIPPTHETRSSAVDCATAAFLGSRRRSDAGSIYCYVCEIQNQLTCTHSAS